MSIIALQLFLASGLPANVYGMGEMMCGDPGEPKACNVDATMANGQPFNPYEPTAAIALPKNYRLRQKTVYLRVAGGNCTKIVVADLKNSRYVASRPLDLTPAAVFKLTGRWPSRSWSEKVFVCGGNHG